MLDQLIHLVKEHAGEAIINNPAIPNEKNDAAISATAGGIFDVLKGQLAGGNLEAITGLFKSGGGENALTGQISTAVMQQITTQFNVSSPETAQMVKQMIPAVLQSLVKKTNDPNDNSFKMDDILSSLGGGKADDPINSVKGFFGQ